MRTLTILLCFLCGCSSATNRSPQASVERVEFAGEVWTGGEEISAADTHLRPMARYEARVFHSTDPTRRMLQLESVPIPSADYLAPWTTQRIVQRLKGKEWQCTGITEITNRNGQRIVAELVNDTSHGKETLYYASGQLKREMHFVNGKRQGKIKAFYESGQLEYEAEYLDDVEVSIRRWDEDGNEM